jgi:hypothetical protein
MTDDSSRTKDATTTWETVERLASELPGVAPGLQRGKPALKVAGRGLIHLGDGPRVSLASPDKEALLASRPDAFSADDHQRETPWFMVELAKVTEDELRELLTEPWRLRAPASLKRLHPNI